MKIVSLEAENYKRLSAVHIKPEGNMITIGGRNGQGKSSVLDAIWAALKGRAANPPQPVNTNAEKATIRLDLGDLVITRTFIDKGDGKPYTDTVKVESAEGLRYGSPQAILDGLLGSVALDPFKFMNLSPADQAEQLLALVPLSIDLDEHADKDASDYANRRDVNREIDRLEGQLSGIPAEDLPTEIPDREELITKLAGASGHNLEIEREIMRRQRAKEQVAGVDRWIEEVELELEQLEGKIAAAKAAKIAAINRRETMAVEIAAMPPLAAAVDVSELQAQIREAEELVERAAQQRARARLVEEIKTNRAASEAFTTAMAERERQREEALAKAKMPVEGLGFKINEKGKPVVTYNGLPFDKGQISTAMALRVSTAIAMAASPGLRVLQIKDGSLLDSEAMAALAAMIELEDFQLWVERVGTEGVGIVIEDGHVLEAS